MHLYVKDVDALNKRAIAAGATVEREIANQFYGDRSVTLTDPFGHRWFFATHVEDVARRDEAPRRSRDEGVGKLCVPPIGSGRVAIGIVACRQSKRTDDRRVNEVRAPRAAAAARWRSPTPS